jgi:hypothetical protein
MNEKKGRGRVGASAILKVRPHDEKDKGIASHSGDQKLRTIHKRVPVSPVANFLFGGAVMEARI